MARSGAARAVGSAGQRGMTLADRISSILARYAHDAAANGLAAETAHEVRDGCSTPSASPSPGFDEPAAVAARRYAEGSAGRVTVWGTQAGASVEAAGFANGVAVRCLDFNDTYLSREPLHPSDTVAALLACAEDRGRGARAPRGDRGDLRGRCDALRRDEPAGSGLGRVNVVGIAAACGAGRLLGLSVPALEHAVALTAIPTRRCVRRARRALDGRAPPRRTRRGRP